MNSNTDEFNTKYIQYKNPFIWAVNSHIFLSWPDLYKVCSCNKLISAEQL